MVIHFLITIIIKEKCSLGYMWSGFRLWKNGDVCAAQPTCDPEGIADCSGTPGPLCVLTVGVRAEDCGVWPPYLHELWLSIRYL